MKYVIRRNGLTLKNYVIFDAMKQKLLLFFVFLNCTFGLIAQQTATISSAEISFTFVSKKVKGTISGFESSSTINLNTLADSKFKGSVALETLKTGNFLRDWHLNGSKYFDADAHPNITFESTEVSKSNAGYSVKGKLTIKGTSKAITIDFKRKENQLIGTTTLFSSDFGIDIKSDREDNEVMVKFVLSLKS